MTKNQLRGCECGCGNGTKSTYAPGHDAKHVAVFVRLTVFAEGEHRSTAWGRAIRQLPTMRLQAKYRQQMVNSANRHLGAIIDQMADAEWQRKMHLQAMVGRIDPSYADRPVSARNLAVVAAAMGLDRATVNYSRS